METTYGRWFKTLICVECEHQLEYQDRRYNRGICPYCGHNSDGIMCKTKDIVIREIHYTYPWWQITLGLFQGKDLSWKMEYKGKDEVAKEWLKKHNI